MLKAFLLHESDLATLPVLPWPPPRTTVIHCPYCSRKEERRSEVAAHRAIELHIARQHMNEIGSKEAA